MSETKRIVVIDPSPGGTTTATLAQRLQMQGYAVSVTQDACEGAQLALSDPP